MLKIRLNNFALTRARSFKARYGDNMNWAFVYDDATSKTRYQTAERLQNFIRSCVILHQLTFESL
jgi:hypothetical protein